MALTKVKTQNLYIKRLAAGKIDPRKIQESDINWQSGHTWVALQETREELFEVYNADLAPADILLILDEVGQFMDAGQKHCQALFEYLSNTQEALEMKKEAAYDTAHAASSTQRQATDWELIDAKHSAVTEGFIYLLANSLMPGVYKIGFTAGNPDKRAREICVKYGLPTPFILVQYWRTKDPYIIEQRIHSKLAGYAKSGEFFEVDLKHATETIQAYVSGNLPIKGASE